MKKKNNVQRLSIRDLLAGKGLHGLGGRPSKTPRKPVQVYDPSVRFITLTHSHPGAESR